MMEWKVEKPDVDQLASLGFELEPRGLLIKGEPNYEQCVEAGRILKKIHDEHEISGDDRIHWAIGDWGIYLEKCCRKQAAAKRSNGHGTEATRG